MSGPRDQLSRRTLVLGGGLSVLALGTVSACSSDEAATPAPAEPGGAASEPSGGASEPVGGGSASAGGGSGDALAKTSDIPVGGGKVFESEEVVVTQPTDGEFKAFTSICTHQGCQVNEVAETINCPCHGSKYSITDGSVVNGPAPSPLAEKTVTVEADSITVSG